MGRTKDDSVRITLRISKECAEAIKWLTLHNKVTQKQLFDKVSNNLFRLMNRIAEEPGFADIDEEIKRRRHAGTVRKAQVVSRRAYKAMKMFLERHGTPRDVAVEKMVFILKAIAFNSNKDEKERHREAKEIIDAFWNQAEVTEKSIKEITGEGDAVLHRFGFAIVVLMNLSQDIERELEKGIPVDPENM